MSRDSRYAFIAIALRCMVVLAVLGAWLLPALRPGQQMPQLIGLIDQLIHLAVIVAMQDLTLLLWGRRFIL